MSTMPKNIKELQSMALKVREHIIRMSVGGGCFIGASLSCTEIIVYLYNNYLFINKNNIDDPMRDYFFLSKGHDVPALYGTLAELGFIEKERLQKHLQTDDFIYWHPNRNIPGVEFHSGSLGHLLSVAAGVAYDCKIKKANNKIVVLLGDGEMNEGSVWEALLVASAKHLDNLLIVIDRNNFQANMETENLIPLEPLELKLTSFGCSVLECNGHDFYDLYETFHAVPFGKGKPLVIIANTTRGKGLASIENRADRWFCSFTPAEADMLIKELHGDESARLTSETLTVR